MRVLILLISILTYGQLIWSQNEFVPKALSLNSDYITGDKLLKEIEDSLMIDRLDYAKTLGGYSAPFKVGFDLHALAKEAKKNLESCFESYEKGSIESIKCLEKIALCEHYLVRDFSHSDSLTHQYLSSIEKINQSISLQKSNPETEFLVELYYVAAQIAIPHFYWGYQSPNAARAEELAMEYLSCIEEIYKKLEMKDKQLRVLRLIESRDLSNMLKTIELGIEVNEPNKLALAYDIRTFIHEISYKKEAVSKYKSEIERMGPIGYSAFEEFGSSKSDRDYFVSLLADLAACYVLIDHDFNRARIQLEKAQKLRLENQESSYYVTHKLAAVYIQESKFDLADKQYQLSLSEEKLSVTVKECAWFGRAVIAELEGDPEKANEIWANKIGNKKIMNGISSYQSYFREDYKSKVKEAALNLIKRQKAPDALRIVEESWV